MNPFPPGTTLRGDFSFEDIFNEERPFVERIAEIVGVPRAYREDVAQEVFLRFSQCYTEIPRDSVRAWLRIVTWRVSIISHYRRRSKHEISFDPYELQHIILDPEPAADMAIEHQESMRFLQSLLEELPPEYRETFRLHRLERMPMREVAAVLGVSQGTSWTRLRIAERDIVAACVRRLARERDKPGGPSFDLAVLLRLIS